MVVKELLGDPHDDDAAALLRDSVIALAEESNFGKVNVVVMSDCMSSDVLARMNDACRARGWAFVALQSFGLYAHFFCDLGPCHQFRKRPVVANSTTTTTTSSTTAMIDTPEENDFVEMHYVSWAESLRAIPSTTPRTSRERDRVSKLFYLTAALHTYVDRYGYGGADVERFSKCVVEWINERHNLQLSDSAVKKWIDDGQLQDYLRAACARGELPAVTAVAGGLVGAELIKFITKTDPTLRNWWFYHAATGANAVETLA